MKGSRLCTDDLSHRRDQTLRFGGMAPEIPVFGNLADGLTSNPPVVALDEIALKLLSLLLKDARATLKSLAEAVGARG